MWTTNPELAKLLADPDDGYKYSQNSGSKIDWKCPNCGFIIKNKKIEDINKYGLSCPKCSDGVSYPEKIMFNILQQLNIEFIYQLSKQNCHWIKNNYRYDFYFKYNNNKYIVEMDGSFHYMHNDMNNQTKEQTKKIDNIKNEMAINNNAKIIRINCSYRHNNKYTYIKNNIIHSELANIFNLSKIDWLQCNNFAYNSLMKQACDLWRKYQYSTLKISAMLHLSDSTIRNYLKQGTKLGWCKYNSKEVQKMNGKMFGHKGIKIICLNNKKIFESISQAKRYLNIKANIAFCCKNKIMYAGIDKKTKERFQWQFYNDYLISPKKLLSNQEIINSYKH